MGETYTITRAKSGGNKPNPHGGQLYVWYIGLKNGDTEIPDAYWQSKRSDVAVGDEVYGRVEEGQYGPRFYTEQQETPSAPANSQASGGSTGYTPSGEASSQGFNAEDARQASIVAQSMFKAAAELVVGFKGQSETGISPDEVVQRVTTIGDKLIAEVNARGRRAGGAL